MSRSNHSRKLPLCCSFFRTLLFYSRIAARYKQGLEAQPVFCDAREPMDRPDVAVIQGFAMMLIRRSFTVCHIAVCCVAMLVSGERLLAGEPAVVFDVSAMLPVQELIPVGVPPVTHSKIVEIAIPVTVEISPGDREHIREFRFDISWSGHAFPIEDYGPKSQTDSYIDGAINVDRTDDSSVGIGLNGHSDKLEVATLTGNADLSKRSSSRQSYKEIPQHHPVIASGTIKRGTGAFFRFHRSRTETLEGGREVVVAFRVGRDWRGGLLKVDCRALGQRKMLGAIPQDIEQSKSFMMPVFIEGDVRAKDLAKEFIVAEGTLRRHWYHRSKAQSKSGSELFLAGFNPFASSNSKSGLVPRQWVQDLIQSGDDRVLRESKNHLAKSTIAVAEKFVSSRDRLLSLSR